MTKMVHPGGGGPVYLLVGPSPHHTTKNDRPNRVGEREKTDMAFRDRPDNLGGRIQQALDAVRQGHHRGDNIPALRAALAEGKMWLGGLDHLRQVVADAEQELGEAAGQ